MTGSHTTQQLIHVPLDELRGEKLTREQRVYLLLEIELHEFKDQVHLRGTHDHILELYNVSMFYFSQNRYLSNCCAWHSF